MPNDLVKTIKEFRRVIGIPEVLFLAGTRLKKIGIRYTAVAALLSLGLVIANTLGERVIEDLNVPVSNLQAILFTVGVALLTFGLGNTLTGLSNLFSTQKIMFADANSMNLMEDKKKAQILDHLTVLWDRVFHYEAALHRLEPSDEELNTIRDRRHALKELISQWPADLKIHFGINNANLDDLVFYIAQFQPLAATLETTRDGFLATASYSSRMALPQKLENHLCGFDLTLLEDWYDGAYLTPDDSKLNQQYSAHSVLRGIRLTIGIPLLDRIREALTGYPNPIWHTLTMKKIAMTAGTHIDRMNKQYTRAIDPNYFDAQDFLWKHDDTDRLILHYFPHNGPNVLHDLRQTRQAMFRSIFSSDRTRARKQIFRMFGRDYTNALNLRLDFDIEFAAGRLRNTPADDLAEIRNQFPGCLLCEQKTKSKTDLARDQLKKIESFIDKFIPELNDNPLALRGVKVGFYVNLHKLQARIDDNPAAAKNIIQEKLISAERRFSQRICLLRQHYELSRIQLLNYAKMIDVLAQYA